MGTRSEVSPANVLASTVKSSGAAEGIFSSARTRTLVLSLLLALVTLAVYRPIVHNAFINVDDN